VLTDQPRITGLGNAELEWLRKVHNVIQRIMVSWITHAELQDVVDLRRLEAG